MHVYHLDHYDILFILIEYRYHTTITLQTLIACHPCRLHMSPDKNIQVKFSKLVLTEAAGGTGEAGLTAWPLCIT